MCHCVAGLSPVAHSECHSVLKCRSDRVCILQGNHRDPGQLGMIPALCPTNPRALCISVRASPATYKASPATYRASPVAIHRASQVTCRGSPVAILKPSPLMLRASPAYRPAPSKLSCKSCGTASTESQDPRVQTPPFPPPTPLKGSLHSQHRLSPHCFTPPPADTL